MSEFGSWGNYPPGKQRGLYLPDKYSALPEVDNHLLPYGLGRSYGDSCRNQAGAVLSSRRLDKFIHFDRQNGIVHCEAGVTLADIIAICLPHGWFLPVTPGTKYVTLGGAIANDVHGKNHHMAGSFGHHVLSFELLRSDGSRRRCSAQENSDWFFATIGGLGLTGFVTFVKMQLKKVCSSYINSESIKYQTLTDFFRLSEDSAGQYEYTVAWLDCLAKDRQLGRGHFIRGNHADDGVFDMAREDKKRSVPVMPPLSLVNRLSLPIFNTLYYHRQRQPQVHARTGYDAFFYPLDGILNWNRIYGKKGFVQHQCVIPPANAEAGIREMLERISHSGQGSFLVVLKMMGDIPGRGLLSFPCEGATLAMDFPFLGNKTLRLLDELDQVVMQSGGRVYPAKDARMSAALFQQAWPQWQELEAMRDPLIMSDFWRRVSAQ